VDKKLAPQLQMGETLSNWVDFDRGIDASRRTPQEACAGRHKKRLNFQKKKYDE